MESYNLQILFENTLKELEIKEKFNKVSFSLDRRESGLYVKCLNREVKIECSEKAFLFRAIGLIKDKLPQEDFEIEENASFTMNGVMLDCSRNAVSKIETVKSIIRQLALMGHNTLMLYTEDTYELEDEPYFGYMRGRYSIDEIKEIDDYAYMYGIEVIPCIQTLGHLSNVLKWGNEYGNITDTGDILLVKNRQTYDFIEKMISTCRKAFRSNRIHIGMDETHYLGRGRYLDDNKTFDLKELYIEHLEKVSVICEKYDFRPMIWGDMLIRQKGCVGYTDCSYDTTNMHFDYKLDDSVDAVYWDYYSTTPERFEEFIITHKRMSDHIIFSGGAWRWSAFAPSMEHSLKTSKMALEKCKKHNVKEVFVTMWGDDGNESSTFISWPVVQLYAEMNFHNNVEDDFLSKRFSVCTGGNFEDFCSLELMDLPCKKRNTAADNPSKYLFYQDPMMGLYDYYVKEGFNAHYKKCEELYCECAKRAGKFSYIFETAEKMCRVLSNKAELGIKIKTAYDNNDTEKLSLYANTTIPQIIKDLDSFTEQFENRWNKENKVFGYEVMDIRFGGLKNRLSSAEKRINMFLNKKTDRLEELEVERIPYDNQLEDTVLAFIWGRIVSTSNL